MSCDIRCPECRRSLDEARPLSEGQYHIPNRGKCPNHIFESASRRFRLGAEGIALICGITLSAAGWIISAVSGTFTTPRDSGAGIVPILCGIMFLIGSWPSTTLLNLTGLWFALLFFDGIVVERHTLVMCFIVFFPVGYGMVRAKRVNCLNNVLDQMNEEYFSQFRR